MIEGVIFDKDGTLFDFRRSWGGFAVAMLDQIADGPEHAAALAARVGFDPVAQDFAPDSLMIAGTTTEIASELLRLMPGQHLDGLVQRLNDLSKTATMYPAVPLKQVLGDLRDRGLKIGLATNDTEAPARVHLSEAGIDHLFDFVAGCDSGHGAKPDPGMLLAFARAVDIDPPKIAMVGDSLHDLTAGRAAGMWSVGVLTGIADRSELAPHADVVLKDIASLADWIDELPRI